MAKVKHKNRSAQYHSSHLKAKPSRLSRTRKRDHKIFLNARRAIIVIIITSIVIVVAAVLLTSFANPESIVKREVESIATDYYENHFYPEITEKSDKSPADIIERYTTSGFARVTLRQLLIFDNERHAEAAAILTTYCDTNDTFVQFFPESPFGKSNYRIEYHYSCTF